MTVICVLCADDAVEGLQLGVEVTFVNVISCTCRIREKKPGEARDRDSETQFAIAVRKDYLHYFQRCVITDVSFRNGFCAG